MKQLKLSKENIISIGFTERHHPASEHEFSVEKTTYQIPTINGYFYFNPNEKKYVWYHKTIVGEMSNHINLDITNVPTLYIVLSAFKVKFNMIII